MIGDIYYDVPYAELTVLVEFFHQYSPSSRDVPADGEFTILSITYEGRKTSLTAIKRLSRMYGNPKPEDIETLILEQAIREYNLSW